MKLLLTLFLASSAVAWSQTALKAGQAQADLSRPVTIEEGPDAALTKSAGPDLVTEINYDLTKNFVVRKRASGTVETLPFLNLPVLFQRDSTLLADGTSASNVKALAEALQAISAKEPGALFQIEGHASKDGADAHNLTLSEERANAVRRALVADCNVKAATVRSTGFGEAHANAPDTAEESELAKDRVVRVVRLR